MQSERRKQKRIANGMRKDGNRCGHYNGIHNRGNSATVVSGNVRFKVRPQVINGKTIYHFDLKTGRQS